MIMLSDLTITRHEKMNGRISFSEAGIEYCAPKHYNGPKVRHRYLIHFVLEGCGKVCFEEKQYEVHAGEAFLIPANAFAYYAADQAYPWKYCWLAFIGTDAANCAEQIFGKNIFVKRFSCIDQIYKKIEQISLRFYDGEEDDLNHDLGSEIFYLYTAGNMAESFLLNSSAYDILAMLLAETGVDEHRRSDDNYAKKIKNYIDSDFPEINEVSQIARVFHLHPNYLTAVFRKQYYTTPKQYLLSRKISYANHLLSETDNSIRYIASVCGFLNTSAFGKIYKKHMGITPGMYRVLNRK